MINRVSRVLLPIAIAIALVGLVRQRLFNVEKKVKEKHDVYFLPPPKQVSLMSLGYKYALADVLWAHVLVSQGMHTFQKRRFGTSAACMT